MSDRDKLLGRRKVAPVVVGGETVTHVRAMTGRELADFRERVGELDNHPQKGLEIVVVMAHLTACDEAGQRLFKDEEWDSARDISADVLIAIGEAAAEVNGLGKDAPPSPPTSGLS